MINNSQRSLRALTMLAAALVVFAALPGRTANAAPALPSAHATLASRLPAGHYLGRTFTD